MLDQNVVVVEKFLRNQWSQGKNLCSDGSRLFSYMSIIAEWVYDGQTGNRDVQLLEPRRRSRTTVSHIALLGRLACGMDIEIIPVGDSRCKML